MRSTRLGGPVVPLVSMRTAVPGRPVARLALAPVVRVARLHRRAGPTGAGRGAPDHERRPEVGRRRRDGAGAGRYELGQVGRFAGQDREVERRDVVAGALLAPAGVDRDHAAARPQDAEEESDRGGPVAQEDADLARRAPRRAPPSARPCRPAAPHVRQEPSNSTAGASGSTARTSPMRAGSPAGTSMGSGAGDWLTPDSSPQAGIAPVAGMRCRVRHPDRVAQPRVDEPLLHGGPVRPVE